VTRDSCSEALPCGSTRERRRASFTGCPKRFSLMHAPKSVAASEKLGSSIAHMGFCVRLQHASANWLIGEGVSNR
jgi:hypothetical protein